ncbi:hypothetical protein B4V02_13395 [Paenibacillus kribbensis]|uniref:WXG100 family type VII secretion target n=1 Tax=Paenibacillus kribbensis TaxID=172713 RepID=A0A222WNM4_9BACL|nr:WXG100 family type VII secretion target [Paenibacillus kribbensis]ASR47598.1 hypothetical protein B4V02_13395 [Paenibacillus kribbensis]
MGRIMVPPEKLIEVADRFLQGKHEMERMLNSLNKQITFVQDGWSGATKEKFFHDFQIAQQSMSVTLAGLYNVSQQLIFISKSFAQVDGEQVVLDIPGSGLPAQTESNGEQWWKKVGDQFNELVDDVTDGAVDVAHKVGNEIEYAVDVGKEFVLGSSAAFTEDLSLGILHKDYDSNHPFANVLGGLAGHTLSSVLGVLGTVVGGAGEVGSFALDFTGIGAIVGVPAGVVSAGMMAAGSSLAFKGISGGFEQTKDMYQMMKDKDSKALEPSKPSDVKTENTTNIEGAEATTRTYEPSPKHDPQSGWGSPNPIPDAKTGQNLLDTAYSSSKNKQLYNIYEGKLVKFQPDGETGWHPYEVTNPAKEVPADVLRQLLKDGKITRVEYNKLLKNK